MGSRGSILQTEECSSNIDLVTERAPSYCGEDTAKERVCNRARQWQQSQAAFSLDSTVLEGVSMVRKCHPEL